MEFGLFDHVDRAEKSLAEQLDERLEFLEAADKTDFYCYHVAEHHASPLNMVPVPGVYLGAVARATRRIHMGPLVYLLPLSSPLRMMEEICLLDHLTHGRLEVGVGRGVSPFELNYHKIDPETSREVFIDAFNCINEGLTHDRLNYEGKYFTYKDVPVALSPYQQPTPPFWYGSSNHTGAAWAGEHGLHFSTNGPTDRAKSNIDAFKAALAKRGGPAVAKKEFAGGTAIGVNRQIVVADTDAEALRIAKPAHEHHHQNLTFLRRVNAGAPAYYSPAVGGFEDAVDQGTVICGSPETVRAEIEKQVAALGVNYFVGSYFFGTMTLKDAMRSMQLFATEVMPKLKHL